MQQKGKAIASMSVGIVATSISVISMILPFFWILAGILSSITAIICGIVAIVLSNHCLHSGRAIAGLVTGIVGCSIGGIVTIVCVLLICFFGFPLL